VTRVQPSSPITSRRLVRTDFFLWLVWGIVEE
jgi:hypothetical protein